VLKRHELTFAHGSFLPHGKKIQEYQTVFDTYNRTGKLGRGGNGLVLKVTSGAGKTYAMKVLSDTDPASMRRKRFANELWFCARKNITAISSRLWIGVYRQFRVSRFT
jgi:hypothetical protein